MEGILLYILLSFYSSIEVGAKNEEEISTRVGFERKKIKYAGKKSVGLLHFIPFSVCLLWFR